MTDALLQTPFYLCPDGDDGDDANDDNDAFDNNDEDDSDYCYPQGLR